MKMIVSLIRKYMFLLWCALFAVAYMVFAYYVTHYVTDAYVIYLGNSVELVNKGVVHYLLDNFKFFVLSMIVASAVTLVLLLLMRQGMAWTCTRLVDRENIYRFSSLCNILLNFIISIGFVFLLGIKDNFFEMYYALFEEGISEVDIAIHKMAFDIEMNWIFCELLVLKMLFDPLFQSNALDKVFQKMAEKKAPAESAPENSEELQEENA